MKITSPYRIHVTVGNSSETLQTSERKKAERWNAWGLWNSRQRHCKYKVSSLKALNAQAPDLTFNDEVTFYSSNSINMHHVLIIFFSAHF